MLHLKTEGGAHVGLEVGDHLWVVSHDGKKYVKSVEFHRIMGGKWNLKPKSDPLHPFGCSILMFEPGHMTLLGLFTLLNGLGVGAEEIGNGHYWLYPLREVGPTYFLRHQVERIKAMIWYRKITTKEELESEMDRMEFKREAHEERIHNKLYRFFRTRQRVGLE